MKFRIRFAEQIVGLFVLVALAGLAAILILMAVNQRWFAKDYSFVSAFPSGNNLSIGMAIRLKGFRIGAVDDIQLLPDNTVQIGFHIYDTYYNKVTPHSILELAISPIGIGGGGLLFHPGKLAGDPVEEGSFIPTLDSPKGKEWVAQGLVDIPPRSDAVSDLLAMVGPTLDNVNGTLVAVETLLTSVDDLVNNRVDTPLAKILVESNSLVANVATITGEAQNDLDSILKDVSLLTGDASREVSSILEDISTLTESLRDTTGIVTRLLGAQGSIPKLLDDDMELYQTIEEILGSLSATAGEVETLMGFVNRKTPQITSLLDQTVEAINQGQEVLTGIKNNPLLRGGIPEPSPQSTTFGGLREGEF